MASYTLGLDLGKERDPSALVIAEHVQFMVPGRLRDECFDDTGGPRIEEAHHIRHIQRFELGTPYDAVVDAVGELMSTPELRSDAVLVFDRTGVGGAVADLIDAAYRRGELGRCYWPLGVTLTAGFAQHGGKGGQFWTTTAHKGDVVQRLYMLLESERLKIPLGLAGAEQLTKEVRAFRPKQNPRTGNLSFEAERESDHDDLVIALALSVWYSHVYCKPRYIDPQSGELREAS